MTTTKHKSHAHDEETATEWATGSPKRTHHDDPPADELKDKDGNVRKRGLLGCFVKVKSTGKVGYIKTIDPTKGDAPVCVHLFTVSLQGAGVNTSPYCCKLSDLEYLYDTV
jgi:hypothetical protein